MENFDPFCMGGLLLVAWKRILLIIYEMRILEFAAE